MDESDRMPEDRDLIVGVIQLGNLFARRLGPMFEKTNLTPQQWAILNVVAKSGPTTLAALARKMIVSKQNMTGMVGRLRKAGYLERNDDPSDLRSARVVLTRRGRAVVEKLMPVYEAWYAELIDSLAGVDITELTMIARLAD
jgi:DNA-binding MarR family transcriptional regulator